MFNRGVITGKNETTKGVASSMLDVALEIKVLSLLLFFEFAIFDRAVNIAVQAKFTTFIHVSRISRWAFIPKAMGADSEGAGVTRIKGSRLGFPFSMHINSG
ncbi:hypothetical protein F971_01517 [Acinetobacter vivianii]|uniref:Uncharacterized protein n=1 Tax=Acinetobacter vivianii TaxID=1776742 RepID=N8WC75_9GAMM|nr:hypothetical protein F971_01517 [Acinetobacter vivianii]